MSTEKCIIEKSEVDKLIIKSCKLFLSKILFKESSNSLKKQEKREILNTKKRTVEINPSIAVSNGTPKFAHSEKGIKDLYLFEYEYGLTPQALIKNSILRIN